MYFRFFSGVMLRSPNCTSGWCAMWKLMVSMKLKDASSFYPSKETTKSPFNYVSTVPQKDPVELERVLADHNKKIFHRYVVKINRFSISPWNTRTMLAVFLVSTVMKIFVSRITLATLQDLSEDLCNPTQLFTTSTYKYLLIFISVKFTSRRWK